MRAPCTLMPAKSRPRLPWLFLCTFAPHWSSAGHAARIPPPPKIIITAPAFTAQLPDPPYWQTGEGDMPTTHGILIRQQVQPVYDRTNAEPTCYHGSCSPQARSIVQGISRMPWRGTSRSIAGVLKHSGGTMGVCGRRRLGIAPRSGP
ncbi:hypothetical protein GGR56DRAFT_633093 [Xylariaceae sp. FL0804]|nr:hypothetical protein GGR56DRAFT_633093 [Xylariaceae sp. FL0804]